MKCIIDVYKPNELQQSNINVMTSQKETQPIPLHETQCLVYKCGFAIWTVCLCVCVFVCLYVFEPVPFVSEGYWKNALLFLCVCGWGRNVCWHFRQRRNMDITVSNQPACLSLWDNKNLFSKSSSAGPFFPTMLVLWRVLIGALDQWIFLYWTVFGCGSVSSSHH